MPAHPTPDGPQVSPGYHWPNPLPAWGPVVLRPFRDTDLDVVAELSSDPYIPQIGSVPAVFTQKEGLAYLARQQQRLTDGTGYSFAIAARRDDRAVGGAGLWPHPPSDHATLGYAVAPGARGRGFATAALTALTAFAWTLPELNRLELLIEPTNAASLAVARRCGYHVEGTTSAHTEIGGVRRDVLRYLLLRQTRSEPHCRRPEGSDQPQRPTDR